MSIRCWIKKFYSSSWRNVCLQYFKLYIILEILVKQISKGSNATLLKISLIYNMLFPIKLTREENLTNVDIARISNIYISLPRQNISTFVTREIKTITGITKYIWQYNRPHHLKHQTNVKSIWVYLFTFSSLFLAYMS